MRPVFLTFLFLNCLLPFSQTDTGTKWKWYIDEVDYVCPDTSKTFRCFTIDTVTGNPITGWLVRDYKNSFSVEQYSNGVQSGFFASYKSVKGIFHLTMAGVNANDNPVQWFFYNPAEQYANGKSYSYGLEKIVDFEPLTSDANNELQKRTIRFRHHKVKTVDTYYSKVLGKESKFRSSHKSLKELINHNDLDTIHNIFPYKLNEWKHPFSHIRFDGYYTSGANDFSRSFRFNADTTVQYLLADSTNHETVDWDSPNVLTGYFSLCNNEIEFRLNNDEIYATGQFYPGFVILRIRTYKQGTALQIMYEFVEFKP